MNNDTHTHLPNALYLDLCMSSEKLMTDVLLLVGKHAPLCKVTEDVELGPTGAKALVDRLRASSELQDQCRSLVCTVAANLMGMSKLPRVPHDVPTTPSIPDAQMDE